VIVIHGDQVLDGHVAVERDDPGAPVVAVLVDDDHEFLADDDPLPLRLVEDVHEIGDDPLDLGQLVDDLLAFHRGKATELHLQDRVRLDLIDIEQAHQAGPRDVDRRRRTDQRDDLVERVERLDITAQDVGAVLVLTKPEAGAPDDHIDLVMHVVPNDLVKA
jgi:hypothetical protein